jgi:hypothetical protein
MNGSNDSNDERIERFQYRADVVVGAAGTLDSIHPRITSNTCVRFVSNIAK